jgi:hypothetical protein
MEVSLIKYSDMYAEASNEQMLLNLARRANGHPAYFMQLGSINSVYSFGMTASSAVAEGASPAGKLVGLWNGSLGLSGQEQPSFSLTPLSGKDFAAAVFDPISAKVFFNLVEQGMEIDKLLRVMAQSVSFTTTSGQQRTLINVPDFDRQSSYRDFLRFAAIGRELQKRQMLELNKEETGFVISNDAVDLIDQLSLEKDFYNFESEWKNVGALTTESKSPSISIKLRTFEGVLTALATEHKLFNKLNQDTAHFLEALPPMERHPVLRIDWKNFKGQLTHPVTKVNFAGKTYSIRDEVGTNWNRDVFILLGHLFAQISLDPSSLPVQQLIQVQ